MDFIYWSVRPSSMRRGNGVKGFIGGIVILAKCEHRFIGVDKNMAQHPSNNISIKSPVISVEIYP